MEHLRKIRHLHGNWVGDERQNTGVNLCVTGRDTILNFDGWMKQDASCDVLRLRRVMKETTYGTFH